MIEKSGVLCKLVNANPIDYSTTNIKDEVGHYEGS